MAKTVTIEINQQQADQLDRLIREGKHGSTYAEVVRAGFAKFAEAHPEIWKGGN